MRARVGSRCVTLVLTKSGAPLQPATRLNAQCENDSQSRTPHIQVTSNGTGHATEETTEFRWHAWRCWTVEQLIKTLLLVLVPALACEQRHLVRRGARRPLRGWSGGVLFVIGCLIVLWPHPQKGAAGSKESAA